jgi:hypothetical protein
MFYVSLIPLGSPLSAICIIFGRSHVFVIIPKLNKLFLNFEFLNFVTVGAPLL